jgi:hypothetical protein
MKRFPLISTLIFVVGLVLAVVISTTRMSSLRQEMYASTPARLEHVYLPVLGIDAFWSNLKWVRLLQSMGEENVKMTNDPEGRKVADYYYKTLDRITDLNPETELFYEFGASHISAVSPVKAIALLQKGERLSSEESWERPQLCAFYADNYIGKRAGNERPTAEELKQQALEDALVVAAQYLDEEARAELPAEAAELTPERAETLMLQVSSDFLESAMEAGGYPARVETDWLRKQAKLEGIEDDPLGILVFWKKHYDTKLAEMVDREAAEIPEGAMPPPEEMEEGATGAEEAPEMAEDGEMMEPTEADYAAAELSPAHEELRKKIMDMAQDLALEYWEKMQEAGAAEKKKLDRNHEQVAAIFFDIVDESGHYSPVSLRSYSAGELYDVATGTPVKPYGLSWAAWEKNGSVVILKGAHCHVTGQPASESRARWEEWWQQQQAAGNASSGE